MAIKISAKNLEKLQKGKPANSKSKFNNKKRLDISTGKTHDSSDETRRYNALKLLEKSGEIFNLKFHEKEENIVIQAHPSIIYEPDYTYFENGIKVYEDFKGHVTADFSIKKRLIINMLNEGKLDGCFRIVKAKGKKGFFISEEYFSN